jgi:hypothetical protein
MTDLETTIERSATKIDPSIFKILLELTRIQPWLENTSEELAELWNYCTSDSERGLVEDLIRRYIYLDSSGLKQAGTEVATHICEIWKLNGSDTLIVAVSDNSEPDGSQMFIQSLKNKFVDYDNWDKDNFINRIGDSINKLNGIKNVVLVDDFIGTGKTVTRRINWYKKKLEENDLDEKVNVYVCSIAAMEFSIELIDESKVDYFCPVWLKKGISEHYTGINLTAAIDDMNNLESRLEPIVRGKTLPNFGYDKSEALFAIEPLNVPNNVFPIFWWQEERIKKKRKTIFKRI